MPESAGTFDVLNQGRQRAAQVFAQITGELPPPRKPQSGVINTGDFITRLAQSWPRPLSVSDRDGMEALCRKLSVTKQVKAAYDATWRRAVTQEEITPAHWSALIALLLAQFQALGETEEYARGTALKRLNAAFAAIDIAGGLPNVPHLPELAWWVEARLAEIVGS